MEFIHDEFDHLMDSRSLSSWAPHFHEFAECFSSHDLPIENLIGFIDGKLFEICRPGKYQQVLYSGHKRIHGIKVQGIVFPNGMRAQNSIRTRVMRHFLLNHDPLFSV